MLFQALNKYLAKRPEVNPVSVCSTSSGFIDKRVSENGESACSEIPSTPRNEGKRKRKAISQDCQAMLEAADKRHEDKLKCFNRFLDIMEKLVNEK
jgi:hypothetical protein